jgi:capsular exopolysaccharide synthesis family protein
MNIIESNESNVHLDEYLDLQKYWLVLKRRWIPATATFIGVLGLSLGYALTLEDVYEAEAKLLIETNNSSTLTGIENDTGKVEVISKDGDPLATEAEILSSRPIVEKIIQQLDLRDDEGELLSYESVVGALKVRTATGTDILEISYQSGDPELAASIVNTAVQIYKEQDTLSNRTEAAAARTFITEQLPQIEANVKKAEARLREFKNRYQIANLGEETSATISNLNGLESQIDTLEAELNDVNARYNRLSSQLGISWQEASAMAAVSQSVAVQAIFERLQEVKVELAQTRNYLSDNSPQVISLQEERAELEQLLDREIAQTLGSDRASLSNINVLASGDLKDGQVAEFADLGLQREGLQERLATLNNTYQSNQQRANVLPRLEEEQKELERQVEAAQSTYETLLGKLQETQIAEEQDIGKVRIVSDAVIPDEAVGSGSKKIVLAGGILGMLSAIAVAFLLDIKDNTIKNTKEAEEMLPYPLQGVIPSFKAIDPGTQRQIPENSLSLVNSDRLARPIREALHNIQVNLKLLESQKEIKTLAITSSVSQEGKSSVSANYAVTQAECGKRILLVDGDLRRPTQHNIWQISNQVGLSNVLNQEVEWHQAVQKVMPNLDVLTAGTIPENPVSLLNSMFMGILMSNLVNNYDRIIFDTPPLVGLADTKIIGKLVDGLLLVVRPGIANYASVSATKKILAASNFTILGIVTNGVDLDKEPYGYQTYYPDKKYLEAAS